VSAGSVILIACGGAAAGTLGALLGLGGGVFLIPFLVLALDVPMHQAIATSIVAVIATSSAGAAMNVERGTVNIRLGMLLEIVTVAGALAGGITASYLDGTMLTKIFAILLFGISGAMAIGGRIAKRVENRDEVTWTALSGEYFDDAVHTMVSYHVKNLPGTMVVSLIAGNISGLLGLGGGIFKVPAMYLLSGIPMKAATATSNFMIGVTAAAGAFIYLAEGHLNVHIAAPAALGVLAGSMLGVKLSKVLKAESVKWTFVIVLLVVAIQLLIRK
jgi:uncharacterized membrane protein YfcA